jgi:hypothetical protein
VCGSTVTMPAAANNPNVMVPLPEGDFLNPSWIIGTGTTNIQSGDQWSTIHLLIESWPLV